MIKKTLRVHKQYNQNNKLQVYMTSDCFIRRGDWGFAIELGEVFQCEEANNNEDHYISTSGKIYHTNSDPHHCYKIEATTDEKLTDCNVCGLSNNKHKLGCKTKSLRTNLPQISKSFIKRFCKMDDINTITVDCECELSTEPLLRYKLKVDSDNVLIIHGINLKV